MLDENSQVINRNHATEIQLRKMESQFRSLKSRNAKDDSNYKLKRQQRIIEILSREKVQLIEEIQLLKSQRNLTKAAKETTQIQTLINEHDELEERLKRGKSEIIDLDRELFQVQKSVRVLKLKQAKATDVLVTAESEEKLIKRLENRLEVENQAFSKMAMKNEKLKEEIKHLLHERDCFLKIWQSMAEDLSNGKKYVTEFLDFILEAYEERDEWNNKLEILRQKETNAKSTSENEVKALRRDLDNETALFEFLDVKTQQRLMVDYEKKCEKKLLKAKHDMELQMQNYEKIIKQIQVFSDESDVDKLAAEFLKREEENFALFNYVNEQNNEIEKLKKSIRHLSDLIDDEKKTNFSIEESQRKELDGLQTELNQLNENRKKAHLELNEMNYKIEQLLKEIENVFTILQCNKSPILKLLGDCDHVTEFNVNLYLGLIERSIMDLIFNGFCVYKERSKFIDFDETHAGEKMSLKLPIDNTLKSSKQLCSRCLIQEKLNDIIDETETVKDRNEILELLELRLTRPDIQKALHSESVCQLPPLIHK